MLLTTRGWRSLGCYREEFTTSHSNPHPGMEMTHRDRLARHMEDLT